MRIGNLFSDAAAPAGGERFDVLLEHRNLIVERIVSSAAITPLDYDQSQDEWVMLLRGTATLEVAGTLHERRDGDHLFPPAGTTRSVRAVSEGALWLAVHLHQDAASALA